MSMEFLVQMKQPSKCGSVSNNEIFNLHLESGEDPWAASPVSCKAPTTFINSIFWSSQPEESKESKNEI